MDKAINRARHCEERSNPEYNKRKYYSLFIIHCSLILAFACNKEVRVTGVKISNKEVTLNVGESRQLTATVKPDNATEKTVYWKSDNTGCVTVDENGRITAIAPTVSTGVRVTVSTMEGGYEDDCRVIVLQSGSSSLIEMVSVQGGTFEMGQEGVATPVHQVTLSSFNIGKYPVTQGQWEAVMGSNPSYFKQGDNYPVETVSWNDIVGTSGAYTELNGIKYYANGFIYKLNAITGKSYRLPTEAEWEYAARGGNQSQGYEYSGSNTIGDVAWYWDNIPSQSSGNSGYGTQTVGGKAPNELGIYDMSGNVWEWCGDWYASYSSGAQNNPTGPAEGSGRVLRGGDWSSSAFGCRVAYRAYMSPGSRGYGGGFRVVLP